MILDSSALIAILNREDEAERFEEALSGARVKMSVASYVESSVVVDRSPNPSAWRTFDRLLQDVDVHLEPVTVAQAELARVAYRDFGRGSGHPAKLNFGDCFSYALAVDKREPLLFKGDDFVHTDVQVASY